jgi:hypothetical protein
VQRSKRRTGEDRSRPLPISAFLGIVLVQPFARGLKRAIEICERALERRDAAVQVEVVAGTEENVLLRLLPELTNGGVPPVLDHPVMQ